MSDSAPLRCNCRRRAETNLRCARCNAPICPDCSVNAAIGMRCRDCGSTRHSPLYQVPIGKLAAAYLVCLTASVFGGWILLGIGLGFGFFALWGALLFGGAIAELALRVTGRKRGTQMEILAGVCTALGLLGGGLINQMQSHMQRMPPGMSAPTFALPVSPMFYAVIGIAVFAAVTRIRSL